MDDPRFEDDEDGVEKLVSNAKENFARLGDEYENEDDLDETEGPLPTPEARSNSPYYGITSDDRAALREDAGVKLGRNPFADPTTNELEDEVIKKVATAAPSLLPALPPEQLHGEPLTLFRMSHAAYECLAWNQITRKVHEILASARMVSVVSARLRSFLENIHQVVEEMYRHHHNLGGNMWYVTGMYDAYCYLTDEHESGLPLTVLAREMVSAKDMVVCRKNVNRWHHCDNCQQEFPVERYPKMIYSDGPLLFDMVFCSLECAKIKVRDAWKSDPYLPILETVAWCNRPFPTERMHILDEVRFYPPAHLVSHIIKDERAPTDLNKVTLRTVCTKCYLPVQVVENYTGCVCGEKKYYIVAIAKPKPRFLSLQVGE